MYWNMDILLGSTKGRSGSISLLLFQSYVPVLKTKMLNSWFPFNNLSLTQPNQTNLDMLFYPSKGRLSSILTDFTFHVPELCPFVKYEVVKFMVSAH